eukprot:1154619-Pelagomonas_calceolata.AAC.3
MSVLTAFGRKRRHIGSKSSESSSPDCLSLKSSSLKTATCQSGAVGDREWRFGDKIRVHVAAHNDRMPQICDCQTLGVWECILQPKSSVPALLKHSKATNAMWTFFQSDAVLKLSVLLVETQKCTFLTLQPYG